MQRKEEVLGRYGLQPDQLELGDVLSCDGASGIVRNGTLKGHGGKKEVAVKLLPMGGATEKEIDSILQEAVALARASESCKYACKLLGMCRKDEHFCLVMKKYAAGSLSKKLDLYADRRAPLHDVERWLVELCQAVTEMHEEGIVLHDLKPANVLLDSFGGLVLADFGLSKLVQNTVCTQATAAGSLRGTVPYMSPEALSPEDFGRPGMPSDVWSLGCTMHELLTGKAPWEGSMAQIVTKVLQGKTPNCSGLEQRIGPFAEVLEECFRFSPTSRPTSGGILAAVRAKCERRSALWNGPDNSALTGAAIAELALVDETSQPAPKKERPTSPGTGVKEVESGASREKEPKEALSEADTTIDSKNLLDAFTTKKPEARVDSSPGRGGLPPGNFRPGGPGPDLGGRGMRPGQPGPGMRGPGGQFVPPGVPPAMLGMQGPNQNGIHANRWGKKPMEPVASKQPLPALHKARNRFVVGKPTDEETAKIKKVKGILNKLTPENFSKLFEQTIDVEINNATTLTIVIAQVFEKALLEPSFCELYAEFSKQLRAAMPKFDEKDEEGRDIKVTVRRMLLNMCQEEFERSIEQVDENSWERSEDEEEKEEKKKLTQEQIGEEKRKIRTRFLGNVRFIGELYKKGFLPEKIMHVCITKLLGGEKVPHEEILEALCKLLSTIGGMVDHAQSKQHMDAYLKLMYGLSKDKSLSSRIRFMLLDVVEMRESGWRERGRKDGPKIIDQVHRDAAQESREELAAASGQLDMQKGGPDSGRRGDLAPMRGGPGPVFPNPPQMRGGPMGRGPGDARLADHLNAPPRGLSARHDDGQLVFGPGGRGRPGFGPPVPMRGEAEDRFRGGRELGRPPLGDRFGERGV